MNRETDEQMKCWFVGKDKFLGCLFLCSSVHRFLKKNYKEFWFFGSYG